MKHLVLTLASVAVLVSVGAENASAFGRRGGRGGGCGCYSPCYTPCYVPCYGYPVVYSCYGYGQPGVYPGQSGQPGQPGQGGPGGDGSGEQPGGASAGERAKVLAVINKEREKNGLNALEENSILQQVGQEYARKMADEGFAALKAMSNEEAHSISGKNYDARQKAAGYKGVGSEILAYGTGSKPNAAVKAAMYGGETWLGWLKSKGHRDALLDPRWTEVGIGVVRKGDSYYYAVEFGKPAKAGDEVRRHAVPAYLIVRLPADARLTIDGHSTVSTAEQRTFITPPLSPGRTYSYELKAHVIRDSHRVTVVRRVSVHPGAETHVRIDIPSGALARR